MALAAPAMEGHAPAVVAGAAAGAGAGARAAATPLVAVAGLPSTPRAIAVPGPAPKRYRADPSIDALGGTLLSNHHLPSPSLLFLPTLFF